MKSFSAILDLDVLDVGEGLQGFARNSDGRGVWVHGAVAPGDRVRARVTQVRPSVLEAELVEVLHASDLRVQPPCPHFAVCGGCSRQHLAYEAQLTFKRKQVADALGRIGGLPEAVVENCVPAGAPYGYRNKVDFSFSEPRRNREPWRLGYHALTPGRPVMEIDCCPLASEEMSRVAVAVRDFLRARRVEAWQPKRQSGLLRSLIVRRSALRGTLLVNLVTGRPRADLMRSLGDELRERFGGLVESLVNTIVSQPSSSAPPEAVQTIFGDGFLVERIGGLDFRISANAFMQVNTAQMEKLYAAALGMAGAGSGDLLVDLYCGAGTLTLLAARQAGRVLGLEANPDAIRDAEENARRLGRGNARFERRDLARGIGELAEAPSVVLADPPRTGLDPACLSDIMRLRPARLVYVSCHPGALARDARRLSEEGFRLERVAPFDLFPQTHHVESVALFTPSRR